MPPAERTSYFNPRSPHGERRTCRNAACDRLGISIHAPRTGSDVERLHRRRRIGISIHAPRTGSDCYAVHGGLARHISIHAPRTGSDAHHVLNREPSSEFQSTLPARGATRAKAVAITSAIFQSTLPARGATKPVPWRLRIARDFNPRSPHGERLDCNKIQSERSAFQSTLPARGATRPVRPFCRGSDYFNPRSPHGERHYQLLLSSPSRYFNPRSPHGERLIRRHILRIRL